MHNFWKSQCIIVAATFFLVHQVCDADVAVRAPVGNADEAFLASLDAAIRQAISDSGQVVASSEIERALSQGAAKEATTPEEFAQIGRGLAVGSILVPSVVEIGDELLVIIQLVESESGQSRSLTRTVARAQAQEQVGAMVALLLSGEATGPETPLQQHPDSPYGPDQAPVEQTPPAQDPSPKQPPSEDPVPKPPPPVKRRTEKPSHLKVRVLTTPADALVSVRGMRGWHATPMTFTLVPSTYTLVVKKSKFSAVRIPVTLDETHTLVRVKMGKNHRSAGVVLTVLGGIAATIGVASLIASTDAIAVWLPSFAFAVGFGATGAHAFSKHEDSKFIVERAPVPNLR